MVSVFNIMRKLMDAMIGVSDIIHQNFWLSSILSREQNVIAGWILRVSC